jgi:hypothetical protein
MLFLHGILFLNKVKVNVRFYSRSICNIVYGVTPTEIQQCARYVLIYLFIYLFTYLIAYANFFILHNVTTPAIGIRTSSVVVRGQCHELI